MIDDASRYLTALAGKDERVTFQLFDDNKKAGRAELKRVLHGTLGELIGPLTALNTMGAGVFVMVNAGDLQGRKAQNVIALRAAFTDVDDLEPREWKLAPSMVVRTGKGRHPYWLLKPGEPLERFRGVQKVLQLYYGKDNVHDLPRVMRVPGFFHAKAEPVMVTLELLNEGLRYTIDQILEAHPSIAPPPRPTPAPAPRVVHSNEQLVRRASAYLAKIPGGIQGQHGSDQTMTAALAIVKGFDLDVETAYSLLVNEYNDRCDPPWSEAELRHKVIDAHDNGRLPVGFLADVPAPPRVQRGRPRGIGALALAPPVDDSADAYDGPVIRLREGETHLAMRTAEALLAQADGDRIYQRGGMLVRAARMAEESVHRRFHVERSAGALTIVPVDPHYLSVRLAEIARWEKYQPNNGTWRPCDPPMVVSLQMMSATGQWTVPPLAGVLEAPTLRPDGSILETKGYDAATGLLFDSPEEFAPVPPRPTKDDAVAAYKVLEDLVGEFPFVAPEDKAAAIAAQMTGLVRRSLFSAPMFGFRAPRPRSGKSWLADIVGWLATGRRCTVVPPNRANPDEEKKRLLSVLMAGDAVVCYDNHEGDFGEPALCQVLTQETFMDRILGESRMVRVSTAVTFLATGNNLTPVGDLTARFIPIDIDPLVEHPEERKFTKNLEDELRLRRPELVVAALTVLRWHHVAGRPDGGLKEWGGFEEWSGWVRAAVSGVSGVDPAAGRTKTEVNDPVRAGLSAFLSALQDSGVQSFTTADLIRKTTINDEPQTLRLRDALGMIIPFDHGTFNSRRVGKWLSANENRAEGGIKIVRAAGNFKVPNWVLTNGGFGGNGGLAPYESNRPLNSNGTINDTRLNLVPYRTGGAVTPETPETPGVPGAGRCSACGEPLTPGKECDSCVAL